MFLKGSTHTHICTFMHGIFLNDTAGQHLAWEEGLRNWVGGAV